MHHAVHCPYCNHPVHTFVPEYNGALCRNVLSSSRMPKTLRPTCSMSAPQSPEEKKRVIFETASSIDSGLRPPALQSPTDIVSEPIVIPTGEKDGVTAVSDDVDAASSIPGKESNKNDVSSMQATRSTASTCVPTTISTTVSAGSSGMMPSSSSAAGPAGPPPQISLEIEEIDGGVAEEEEESMFANFPREMDYAGIAEDIRRMSEAWKQAPEEWRIVTQLLCGSGRKKI